jgi:hypothetical protein
MNDFLEYEISLDSRKIVFTHEGEDIFQGVFKRKWILWGPMELKGESQNFLASFDHEFVKPLLPTDVRVSIQFNSDAVLVINFVWEQPHAKAHISERDFLVIFHRGVMASIWEDGNQIGSLRAPSFRKPYKLTVRKDKGIENLFWLILGVIYKLDIVDEDDAGLDRIGPFQRELQPFDAYWKQKQ